MPFWTTAAILGGTAAAGIGGAAIGAHAAGKAADVQAQAEYAAKLRESVTEQQRQSQWELESEPEAGF